MATILYKGLSKSRMTGFTLINRAENYNWNNNEWSNFERNFRPIKTLGHVQSDIRWYDRMVN